MRLAGCGPFVCPANAPKVGNYVHPWVHPVHGHVLLQYQCDMPGTCSVCHPPYVVPYVGWPGRLPLARHHMAMARHGAAYARFPSYAWHRAALLVAMARRSAAAVARRGVAAAFLPSLAWRCPAVAVAMARRGAAALAWRDVVTVPLPSVARPRLAVTVAMARRCAAAVARRCAAAVARRNLVAALLSPVV